MTNEEIRNNLAMKWCKTNSNPFVWKMLLDLANSSKVIFKISDSITRSTPMSAFAINDVMIVDGSCDGYWQSQYPKNEITLQEMIDTLAPVPPKFDPINIRLDSGEYTAVMHNTHLQVGCQRIGFKVLDSIIAAYNKVCMFNTCNGISVKDLER